MIGHTGMIGITSMTSMIGMIYETIYCLESLWYNWCL